MTQSDLFWEGEGDRYFERNDSGSDSNRSSFHDVREILRILSTHAPAVNQVLEIGCSSGRKLEKLCEGFSARGVGVDPSAKAVEEGNRRLQNHNLDIELFRNLASELGFPDGNFDLVFLGFFLYVEDRGRILESLVQADRVLRAGGFLAVRDFAPEFPYSKPYSHDRRASSFKNNYAEFFLSLHHYVLVANLPFNTEGEMGFELNHDFRENLVILYKKPFPYPDFPGQ